MPVESELMKLLAAQRAGQSEEATRQLLERLMAELASRSLSITPEERADLLRRRYKLFLEKHEFVPGQLVKWKEGLKNKRRPGYGEPAIVIKVLPEPILDKSGDAGSPYFREPLDLLLGVIDEDGDFIIFHYDKRRFEPFE